MKKGLYKIISLKMDYVQDHHIQFHFNKVIEFPRLILIFNILTNLTDLTFQQFLTFNNLIDLTFLIKLIILISLHTVSKTSMCSLLYILTYSL